MRPTLGHLRAESPRAEAWRRVFGGLDVPILSPIPAQVDLPIGRRRCFFLRVDALDQGQRERLIHHIATTFGVPADEAARDVYRDGVPLLEDDVSVTADLRLFL